MMPWWVWTLLVLGPSEVLWGMLGLLRLSEDRIRSRPGRRAAAPGRPGADGRPGGDGAVRVGDVAVLIPAHNEAVVIGESLRAIMRLSPRRNVHVVSDGSTDDTAAIARRAGATVMETARNAGKADALQTAIDHFHLIGRFRAVMILDADTRVQPGYFDAALPLFDRPGVVAVAACAKTDIEPRLSLVGNMLVSYRQRVYSVGQRLLKYGQAWLRTNAVSIVPGLASIYRTDVLPYLDLNPPGLVTEDYNMTFDVYQKRLGKVAFTLSAVAITQDPDNFRDYVRQMKRWQLGFWQTLRRHRPQWNLFTLTITLLMVEALVGNLAMLLLPALLITLFLPHLAGVGTLTWPVFGALYLLIAAHVSLPAVIIGVAAPDLLLTAVVSVVEQRPRLVLFTAFFVFMRFVDSVISFYVLPVAWLARSSGRWRSPTRRPVVPGSGEALAP